MNVLVLNPGGGKLTHLVGKVLKLRMEEQYRRHDVKTLIIDLKDLEGFRVGDKVMLTSYTPEYLSKIYSLPNATRVTYEGFFPEDVLLTLPIELAPLLHLSNVKMLFEPWVITKEHKEADGAIVTETKTWQYTPSDYDRSVLRLHGISLP